MFSFSYYHTDNILIVCDSFSKIFIVVIIPIIYRVDFQFLTKNPKMIYNEDDVNKPNQQIINNNTHLSEETILLKKNSELKDEITKLNTLVNTLKQANVLYEQQILDLKKSEQVIYSTLEETEDRLLETSEELSIKEKELRLLQKEEIFKDFTQTHYKNKLKDVQLILSTYSDDVRKTFNNKLYRTKSLSCIETVKLRHLLSYSSLHNIYLCSQESSLREIVSDLTQLKNLLFRGTSQENFPIEKDKTEGLKQKRLEDDQPFSSEKLNRITPEIKSDDTPRTISRRIKHRRRSIQANNYERRITDLEDCMKLHLQTFFKNTVYKLDFNKLKKLSSPESIKEEPLLSVKKDQCQQQYRILQEKYDALKEEHNRILTNEDRMITTKTAMTTLEIQLEMKRKEYLIISKKSEAAQNGNCDERESFQSDPQEKNGNEILMVTNTQSEEQYEDQQTECFTQQKLKKAEDKNRELQRLLGEKSEKYDLLTKEHVTMKNSLKQFEITQEKHLEDLKTLRDDYNNKLVTVEDLTDQNTELKRQFKSTQEECDQLIKAKNDEFKNLSERYDLLTQEHVATKNSLKQFEITQEKYLEDLKTLRDEYNNKLVTAEDLADQNKELKQQFENTQDERDQLMKEKNDQFKNLSERYDLLTQEHVATQNSLKQCEITQEKYLQDLKTLRDEYNNKLVTVEDLTDQNKELKRQFKNTQDERDQLSCEIKNIQQQNYRFQNVSERYDLLRTEHVVTKNSLKEFELTQQKHLQDLKILQDRYNNKMSTVEKLTLENKELKRQFGNAQDECNQLRRGIKNVQEKYGTLKEEYDEKILIVTNKFTNLENQYKYQQNECFTLQGNLRNTQENNGKLREKYSLLKEAHDKNVQKQELLMGTMEKFNTLKQQFEKKQQECIEIYEGKKKLQDNVCSLKKESLRQEAQFKLHQENLIKKQKECSKIIDEYKTLERKYYNLSEKYNNLILTNKEMEKTINSNNTLLKERDLKAFKLTDSKITQLELEKASLETKIKSYETTLNEKTQLTTVLQDQVMRLNAMNEDLSKACENKHKVAEEIRTYKTKYVATSEQNRFLTAKIKELEAQNSKFKERSADVEKIRGELHEVESRLNATSKELRRIRSRCICDGPNSSPTPAGSWKTKRRSIQDNQRDMSCSSCNELNEKIKKLEMKIFNVESQQLLPREQGKGELYYQSLVETQQEQLQTLQTNYDKLILERNKLLQKQCAWGFLENNVSNSLETKKELERLQEELKKISIKYEQAKTIAHRRGKKITELENQLQNN